METVKKVIGGIFGATFGLVGCLLYAVISLFFTGLTIWLGIMVFGYVVNRFF